MSDRAVALTYVFRSTAEEREPNGGGEMERTGRKIVAETERTIIVPSRLADEMFSVDWKTVKRSHPDAEIVSGPLGKEVSMHYPAPHFWMGGS